MKNANHYVILMIATVMIFIAGCSKRDSSPPVVLPVALEVQLNYDADQEALGLPVEGIEVKIKNAVSGETYTAITNADGIAVFESIIPGNYTVSTSNSFSAEEYENTTGISTSTTVSFNASTTAGIQEDQTIEMTLKTGKIGDLVFKQIYYAGSNAAKGAVFRDQFIEIYNNSNETIYADSLYFGNSQSNVQKVSAGATRWDWSQSIGMPAGIKNPSDDYVYARFLFMIPGSGKDHPIAPGKSIVIAQSAINHTAPYIDNSGKEQGITDPSLTVDLSHADFETYVSDFLKAQSDDPDNFAPYRWDMNNPDVPNVKTLWFIKDKIWILNPQGKEDFFMFKTSEDVTAWPSYPDPTVTSVDNETNTYKQIPVKYVIDAVEIAQIPASSETPKRLPVTLDGGRAAVDGGAYSSQSLIRKTLKVVNGRIILQDTNNSSADFETKQKADPSKSAASFTTD